MRHARRALLCIAITTAATSLAVPSALARTATSPHPVVGELSVARVVASGKLPRVTLKIDESGVHMVYVQVILTSLDSHSVAAVLSPGWLATRRVLHLLWPTTSTVPAGSYQLSVSAHDHRGMKLERGSYASDETTITVDGSPLRASTPAVPAPVTAPAAPTSVAPTPEAGVPSVAQTVAEGAVFPVAGEHNFGGPENVFGAPRDGYSHQGQDILTSEGTPIVAPLAGTILTSSYQEGGAGYYAVEHTASFDFMFAHCQAGSVAVSTEQAVAAGQVLCHAGQTGDATTPHVDFEMWVNGWQTPGSWPVNPLPYLETWEHDDAAG
jgi:murein DD-endopeptidase MepM/ murein hydrolase activator NlpD